LQKEDIGEAMFALVVEEKAGGCGGKKEALSEGA